MRCNEADRSDGDDHWARCGVSQAAGDDEAQSKRRRVAVCPNYASGFAGRQQSMGQLPVLFLPTIPGADARVYCHEAIQLHEKLSEVHDCVDQSDSEESDFDSNHSEAESDFAEEPIEMLMCLLSYASDALHACLWLVDLQS